MADHLEQRLGNYQLISLLGTGGFAHVYLGEHLYLKTRAAIKVLDEALEEEQMERFRFEASTLAHLSHPSIIRLLDYGVENTRPYLIMDYAPHGTLRQRHPQGTIVPLAMVITYVQHVAAALEYAHQRQIIHRDIKPENLLVGRTHEVLLSDFGIAVVAPRMHSSSTRKEMGTVGYMAPEQLRRRPHQASDQYALAIVVYEWLTGRLPFEGTPIEVAMQQLELSPPPMRGRGSPIPEEVEQVVRRALEKQWSRRFANVGEFARALQEASFPHRPLTPAPVGEQLCPLPVPATPRDRAPTATWPFVLSTPAFAEATPGEPPGGEAVWCAGPVEGPTLPVPQDDHPLVPSGQLPRNSAPPEAWHTRQRRANHGKALLALLALFLLVGLSVGGVLAGMGIPQETRRVAARITASPVPTMQPGSTSAPGASGTPSGNTPSAPAASSTASPVGSGSGAPTSTPPILLISPPGLTFPLHGNCAHTNRPKTLSVHNSGGGALAWSATLQNPAALSIDRSSGTLESGQVAQITVTANCFLTSSETDTIIFRSNGGTFIVTVTITVKAAL